MLKKILAFGFGLGAIGLLIVSFLLYLVYILSLADKNEAGLIRLELGLSAFSFLVPAIFAATGLLVGLKKTAWAGVLELVLGGLGLATGWFISRNFISGNTTGYWLIETDLAYLISGALLVVSGILFIFVRRLPSKQLTVQQ